MYLSSFVSERTIQLSTQRVKQRLVNVADIYAQQVMTNFNKVYCGSVIQTLNALANVLTEPIKLNEVSELPRDSSWLKSQIHFYAVAITRGDWDDEVYCSFFKTEKQYAIALFQRNGRKCYDVQWHEFGLTFAIEKIYQYRLSSDSDKSYFNYEGQFLFTLDDRHVQCWSTRYNDSIATYPIRGTQYTHCQPT